MFIAMNNFKVREGKETEFEQTWRSRKSYLEGAPGFVRFALLRSDGEGEYISHSTWQSRDAFVAWTKSEAFVAGHRQGSLMGMLEVPPVIRLYQAVLEEDAGA